MLGQHPVGPDDVSDRPGMQVPPHPHTGLQTVTWLVEGHDSFGNEQTIEPLVMW